MVGNRNERVGISLYDDQHRLTWTCVNFLFLKLTWWLILMPSNSFLLLPSSSSSLYFHLHWAGLTWCLPAALNFGVQRVSFTDFGVSNAFLGRDRLCSACNP